MSQQHIHHQYDIDLHNISSLFLEMAYLVETQLDLAIRTLQKNDLALPQIVIQQEEKVDEYEIEIDALCSSIIARRQPIASDLRLIIAISKMTTNLERIGDEANKIAKRAYRLISEQQLNGLETPELLEEALLAFELLGKVIEAFEAKDPVQAQKIIESDKLLDGKFVQVLERLTRYISSNSDEATVFMDLVFIAKGLERIGDHVQNIAELIIYLIDNKDIRHI